MKESRLNQVKTISLTGVLGVAFLLFFYGSILKSPNEVLYADWGDGIKNYYTYAYHIEHDSSYIHFEGMNYPYGELHQFTDGQPFLSGMVKALDNIFPEISNHSIGILNFLMLISLAVAAIFIALILREFKVPIVISAISSIVILSLAPQIHRFGGHLSLSYFFAFPLLWYLVIRFYKNPSISLSLGVFIFNLILLFTHPYLSVMNAAFIIGYYLFYLFLANKDEHQKKLFFNVLLQSVLPIILWLVFFAIYDFHPDRPQATFTNRGTAVFHEVFLPNLGMLKNYLNGIVSFKMRWESWAYIGTVTLIVFLFLLGKGTKGLIKRRKFEFFPSFVPFHLRISFLASVVVLLYAFGMPYTTGFWFILEWIPALQQIRAVARFSWVFFFVLNVLTVVALYHYLLKSNISKIAGYALLFIALAATFLEGKVYHDYYSGRFVKTSNYFQKDADTELNKEINKALEKIDTNSFQAILPLPYYHVGSGVYGRDHLDQEGFAESLVFSYQSGLPLVSVTLSRTSLTETKSLTRITAPPFVEKPVLENFDERPILVLISNMKKVREEERWIVDRSEKILSNKRFGLFSIRPEKMTDENYPEELFSFLGITKDSIVDLKLKNKEKNVFYKHFKDGKVNYPLDTSFSVRKKMAGMNLLFESNAAAFDKAKEYEISLWYYNQGADRMQNHLLIVEKDKKGKARWTHNHNVSKGLHLDNWTLVTLTFQLDKNTEQLRVFLNGQKKSEEKMYFTDFMIREKSHKEFGMINDSTLFYNNFRITLNE